MNVMPLVSSNPPSVVSDSSPVGSVPQSGLDSVLTSRLFLKVMLLPGWVLGSSRSSCPGAWSVSLTGLGDLFVSGFTGAAILCLAGGLCCSSLTLNEWSCFAGLIFRAFAVVVVGVVAGSPLAEATLVAAVRFSVGGGLVSTGSVAVGLVSLFLAAAMFSLIFHIGFIPLESMGLGPVLLLLVAGSAGAGAVGFLSLHHGQCETDGALPRSVEALVVISLHRWQQ
jgi:hypothetical protein